MMENEDNNIENIPEESMENTEVSKDDAKENTEADTIKDTEEASAEIQDENTSLDENQVDDIQTTNTLSEIEFPSADTSDTEDDNTGETSANKLVTVRPVKFKEFEAIPPNRSIKKNFDIMQDIDLHVSVELGRTKSSIKEVMDLTQGSIVELNKIAGEQVEIFVNGKAVAKGEVIVIEDRFGVRVTSTNLQKNNTNL